MKSIVSHLKKCVGATAIITAGAAAVIAAGVTVTGVGVAATGAGAAGIGAGTAAAIGAVAIGVVATGEARLCPNGDAVRVEMVAAVTIHAGIKWRNKKAPRERGFCRIWQR